MLSEKMVEMLNEQINMELFSAYLYLEMANYYRESGLDGMAHWFDLQVEEEQYHANLIRAYLLDNSKKVVLGAIEDPTTKFDDFAHPLKLALEHEKVITASIHKIYGAAFDAKDFRTTQFLDWFVEEQLEEEASFNGLIDLYENFSFKGKNPYPVDREMSKRVREPMEVDL